MPGPAVVVVDPPKVAGAATDVVMPAKALEDVAARALAAGGMRREDAAETARILVLADLLGIRSQGVRLIPSLLDQVRVGAIDPQARIHVERVAGAVMRVDGANGIGPLVASRALHAAMQAAHGAGIAAAFVRRSNSLGSAMPYGFIAARHGFASIVAVSAASITGLCGGQAAGPGGAPLGVTVPRPGGDPVMFDMIAGAAAPFRAEAVSLGGLAMMVDLLAGVLSGAAFATDAVGVDPAHGDPQRQGHAFILVDTARLASANDLGHRVDAFREAVRATPALEPGGSLGVPGEKNLSLYREQMAAGVSLDAADAERLRVLAGA